MDTSISTIAHSIAALSVSGVTLHDIHDIPPDCTRLVPCLIPEPLNYVTNYTSSRDSFGPSSTAQKTVEYDLNYTYLFAEIGSGRTGLDFYDDMVAKFEAILDVIHDNDTLSGVVDIMPQGAVDFGPVPDPAGNQYLGCRLVLHCIEFE